MGVEVKLVNTTVEVDDTIAVQNALHDQFVIAGKAAGVCYGPEDYFDKGYNNPDKAFTRATGALAHGHYSTFEHGHLTFHIKCSKIAAMILNSTRLYNTSEKSARYTEMIGTTDLEKKLYDKWKNIFINLIKANKEVSPEKFLHVKSDKDIEKIAMENARYLLSISTPTQLEFTVPYGRALLLPDWIDDFVDTIICILESNYYDTNIFNHQIRNICGELTSISMKIDDLTRLIAKDARPQQDEYTPKNYKSLGIDFSLLVSNFSIYEKFVGDGSETTEYVLDAIKEWFKEPLKDNHNSDSYKIRYECSFAALAQLERHRTLKYQFDFLRYYSGFYYKSESFYVPRIILKDVIFKKEWLKDCESLNNQGIIIQANMVAVEESGNIIDFYTKAKDRMCMRAQLETAEITKKTLESFFLKNKDNFSKPIQCIIENTYHYASDDNKDGPGAFGFGLRCTYKDFTCLEACPYFKQRVPNRIV